MGYDEDWDKANAIITKDPTTLEQWHAERKEHRPGIERAHSRAATDAVLDAEKLARAAGLPDNFVQEAKAVAIGTVAAQGTKAYIRP